MTIYFLWFIVGPPTADKFLWLKFSCISYLFIEKIRIYGQKKPQNGLNKALCGKKAIILK